MGSFDSFSLKFSIHLYHTCDRHRGDFQVNCISRYGEMIDYDDYAECSGKLIYFEEK